MTTLPTLFISHGGGPWPFMRVEPPDMYDGLAAWLRDLPRTVGPAQAALVISAHWEEGAFTVMTGVQPPMLYDYYGFPEDTYRLSYPAPGAPALARRARELLAQAGIACESDAERGFDHGAFVPFMVAYPDARLPIVQLSLRADLDPAAHVAVGRALAPLRHEGVLIAGSGMSYHNLRLFGPSGREPAAQFDAWLTSAVTETAGAAREEQLVHWATAPSARLAHPRAEHLIPLMVAAGAAADEAGARTFSGPVRGVPIACFRFG